MKLRDKYFNKDTGEIRVLTLIYNNKLICGLSLETEPSKIIMITKKSLKKDWEKYEDNP